VVLVLGEILFDVFPRYKRLGGAPFNVAFHLNKLGIASCFISRIGKDNEGKEILDILKQRRFPITHIQVDDHYPTGKVLVKLDSQGIPTFNILADAAYDYIEYNRRVATALKSTDLIYFGSLVQRTQTGFFTLQTLLKEKKPDTMCLYDVNLRPGGYNKTVVSQSLLHSNVLKLNEEELEVIKGLLGFRQGARDFIAFLMKEYSLDMIALTRGEKGSDLYTQNSHHSIGIEKQTEVADTVGAGDAYTAILVIGYLQGWGPEKILEQASTFAGEICQIKGAIPADDQFYENYNFLPGKK
jgi:fructokinase